MPDLKIKNLNLSSISPKLSQSFDFSVTAGLCMGITGPSGIGKSVLLKALADMLPHQGEVYLGDVESRNIPAPQWRRQVALLPAESQWWCETVGEHFEYHSLSKNSLEDHRLQAQHLQEQQKALFHHLGFENDIMDWQISHLSSGEKQRLACIRMLMNQPEALLLDEPTANLDKINRNKLELLIADYQSERQVPVLWVSHDQEQLARVSQELLLLENGHYTIQATSQPTGGF